MKNIFAPTPYLPLNRLFRAIRLFPALRIFPVIKVSSLTFFCLMVSALMVSCLEDNEGNQNLKGLRMEGVADITAPGQKLYLKVHFVPENEYSDTIYWSVTPKEVAKIDANGVLSPLKNGTVRVVATAPKEEVSVAVIVHISRQRVPAEQITIIGEAPISQLGGKLQLSSRIEPDGAVAPELLWEVNNPRLATITQTGLLSAHTNGTVKVQLLKVVDGTKTVLDEVYITLSNQNLLDMYKGNWQLTQLKNVLFSGYNHDADSAVMDMLQKVQPLFLQNQISFDRQGRMVIRQFDRQT
ncbi:MAG: Ig domain-containing protein, partial [Bacteroidales bacterium]